MPRSKDITEVEQMIEELMAEARIADLKREYASLSVRTALKQHAEQQNLSARPSPYGWRRRVSRARFASGHSWLKSE